MVMQMMTNIMILIIMMMYKKGPKGSFLRITLARKRKGEKERTRRKKGEEQKKAMVSLLAFILPMFRPKKLLTE